MALIFNTGWAYKHYFSRMLQKRTFHYILQLRMRNLITHFGNINQYSLSMPSLTLSLRRSLSYRNQSIDLLLKSMDWFLYDNGLRHERVNLFFKRYRDFYIFMLIVNKRWFYKKTRFAATLPVLVVQIQI